MYSVNQIVNVTSFYFTKGSSLKAFPRAIEFGNTSYTFQDGLQYLIKKGSRASHLDDKTDLSARSGPSRTREYGEGASEKKISSGAKKPAESGAMPQSKLAGAEFVRLFDMSDGRTTYRLRLENDQWTLVGTKAA